jgi:hypothetical protein
MSTFKTKNGLVASAIGQTPVTVSASDVNLSAGMYFAKTMSGAITFTFSNPPPSGHAQSFLLEVTGDGNGITWPASVIWENGITPTDPPSSAVDVFVFLTVDSGTTYIGKKIIEGAA